MAKKTNKSRLSETNFAPYNLRQTFINPQAEYIAALRDCSLFSVYGVTVLIKVPCDEEGNVLDNEVSEYNNFVNDNWLETTETVIPKFKEYRQILDENGMTSDGTDGIVELEVLLPTKLHLPRDSRIVFNEYDCNEYQVSREWQVLGTIAKQLSGSKTYTRIASCVPARQGTIRPTDPITTENIIWFDHNLGIINKIENLRAQGTIWFLRNVINKYGISKIYQDAIQEQVPENPEINEHIFGLMFYDSRPKYILQAGTRYEINKEYPLLDENNQQIQVLINDVTGEYLPLSIIVKDIDNNGGITEFEFNTNQGYTDFEDKIKAKVGDNKIPATIFLRSLPWKDEIYQETIKPSQIRNLKYIKPNKLEMYMQAKGIIASILN